MSNWYWWLVGSGVILNLALIFFILLVIWVWFIWPFIEACSLARAFYVHGKTFSNPKLSYFFKYLWHWYKDLLFGRDWTSTRKGSLTWEGVGKWRISDEDSY